jgi:squalene-hopene/tetraprenyl-beta-curcumene cyclase
MLSPFLLALLTVVPGETGPAKMIEQATPFIEKEGIAWIEERKCASCHQVPFMLWSLGAAVRAGVDADGQKLAKWRDWTFDFCVKSTSTKTKEKDGGGLDTMGQMLFVFHYASPSEKQRGDLRELAGLILKSQQTDGSWQPGGQLPGQRRPKIETTAVTTGWALLSLATQDGLPGFEPVRERALAWLKNVKSDVSNEWLVVRLLLADRFGSAEEKKSALGILLKAQNSDGGWGWVNGQKSDALATGQSLYALAAVDVTDSVAIQRAHKFLADSQAADGSWPVPSTKNGRIAPTSTYWGTCWAVIGLSATSGALAR